MKQLLAIAFVFAAAAVQAQGEKITFHTNKEYPEGLAYDVKDNVFYVSSVNTGTIGKIDRGGQYRVLYSEPSLKSSFGMKIDPAAGTLWVCTGDPNYSWYADSLTYKKMIRLVGIDLATGTKLKDIDLSGLFEGKHFANDLTIDADGNIYITDSYSPVIYRVTKNGQASVFSRSDYFRANDVGLNGIVWHPNGYLLAVNNAQGTIYKISTVSGTQISKVKIGQFFPGADGLLLDGDHNLVLVQNKGVNKVFTIASSDDFSTAAVQSATKATDRFNFPSTSTNAGGKIYVLNAKLHELQDPGIKPSREFTIQEAVFRPAR